MEAVATERKVLSAFSALPAMASNAAPITAQITSNALIFLFFIIFPSGFETNRKHLRKLVYNMAALFT
ncbi:hypothetical protein M5585_19585 [Serratia ureilytica]